MKKADCGRLVDAIDLLIEKADDDLELEISGMGYAAAADAVTHVNAIEDAVATILGKRESTLLKRMKKADSLTKFIENVWPEIEEKQDVIDALHDLFKEEFEQMMRGFTGEFFLSKNPVVAEGFFADERLTTPAQDFITGWSEELAQIMNLNSKNQIESILLRAADKGMTIEETAEKIADAGIRTAGYKARRVAITEVLRAESYAQMEYMRQDPVVIKKTWIETYEAEEPRPNHIDISGQTVFKNEPFTLIGKDGGTYRPMQPRDTGLPASEVIHCHCTMEEVRDDKRLGMTADELKQLRQEAMDKIDAEWEEKVKKLNEERAKKYDANGVYVG